MCGLIGIINSNPKMLDEGNKTVAAAPYKQTSLFHDMMLASAVRGVDGTGIYQVDHTGKVWTDKCSLPSAEALKGGGMTAMVQDTCNASITVGHVRAATQGSVEDANCHPFQAFRDDGSYIIGVHNGTLHGWDTPKTEFEVDSEWAFNQIAQKGIAALDEFYGAFTFLWYDSNTPGKLWIARNTERPLHLMRSPNGRSIYMASEAGMLQWLVDKHNISVEEDVFSLDTNNVVTIDTLQPTLTVNVEDEFFDNYSYASTKSSKSNTASCPVPSATYLPSYGSAKTLLVQAMKDCLRRARYSLVGGTKGEDLDSPPIELGPVDLPYKQAPSSWYSIRGVDGADVQRAVREGLFGTLVQYEAVEHDSFQDLIVGEIIAPARLNSPIAYMREVPMDKADGIVDKLHPVVIVGARHFGNEMEYIVSPINAVGMQALTA